MLFSADHVMSWSTSVVSPPGGDMKDYFNSLNVLLKRDDDVYLPGHGPALREPRELVRAMLAHRVMRENAIAEKLKEGAASTYTLMDTLYSQVNPQAAPRRRTQRSGASAEDGNRGQGGPRRRELARALSVYLAVRAPGNRATSIAGLIPRRYQIPGIRRDVRAR